MVPPILERGGGHLNIFFVTHFVVLDDVEGTGVEPWACCETSLKFLMRVYHFWTEGALRCRLRVSLSPELSTTTMVSLMALVASVAFRVPHLSAPFGVHSATKHDHDHDDDQTKVDKTDATD